MRIARHGKVLNCADVAGVGRAWLGRAGPGAAGHGMAWPLTVLRMARGTVGGSFTGEQE
jgi:hypothetical protein